MNPTKIPDHHDADLVIRFYELRREPTMRESRNALSAKFLPRDAQEALAITKSDHPLNAAYRQVGSYWEMVYGTARWGIVNAEYLLENNGGEGLFLYAKVEPYLAEFRKVVNPMAFRSSEWIARESAEGGRLMALFRARIEKMLAST